MSRQLRVVGIEGPGDAIASFRYWRSGRDNPNVLAVPYSTQFFDACDAIEARVLFISAHERLERIEDGNFIVENRGRPAAGMKGIRYHLAELNSTRRLLAEIHRFRADVVVTTWSPYTFLFGCLRYLGIRCVVRLHCTIWPKFHRPARSQRLLHGMYGWFLGRRCDAAMCVSDEVKQQVRRLTRRQPCFVDFFPHYRPTTFADIPSPNHTSRPFRVLFLGRLERNKGVFDLLRVAQRIRNHRSDIAFELCGDGSDASLLRRAVAEANMQEAFVLNGWCDHARMREAIGRSHVVIVPTRTDFIEGLAGVIPDALLAGRPVITSPVCPALDYSSSAIEVVPPEDIEGYEAAIVRLADDADRYHQLQSQSRTSALEYYNPSNNFNTAMKHVFAKIARGEPVTPREFHFRTAAHAQQANEYGELIHPVYSQPAPATAPRGP